MLHGAGQALLQGSAPIYHQNLKQVTRITREYFDSASQVTIGFLADVDKLQAARIAAELPDISASLTQLRRLSTRRTAAP
jgi:uncharacterized protein HemX